ncbi:MAG TPA: DUF5678 domain-containing protein [Polyangiaceae bacterium]
MAATAKTTLYLRGVPRSVVREAKAAAARDGVTLARWVSDRLAAATGGAARVPAPRIDLQTDLAWYEANRTQLEREYPGEYVAIIDEKLVDHDGEFERLASRVFAKYGARPVCMPRVGRSVVRVRSPRRAAG